MSTESARRSPGRLAWRRFTNHPAGLVSLLVLLVLAMAALGAPLARDLLGSRPFEVDLFERLLPPSAGNPLGTDELGRDLLTRLLYGGRVSLFVGIAGALVSSLIGTAVGLLAGFVGGRLDDILMRLTDAVIALPILPLLIVLAALDLQKLGLPAGAVSSEAASIVRIVAIVALFGWTTAARLVRASVLSIRRRDFVLAARALGATDRRIMVRHILPNALTPVIVASTISVGSVMLLESVLSFLGLGIQPPIPSWGNMLNGAQELIWQAPGLAIWPGFLIFVTVMAWNLLGDALRDALDPRTLDQVVNK